MPSVGRLNDPQAPDAKEVWVEAPMTGDIPAYLLRLLRPGQAEPAVPTGLQLRQIEFIHHVLQEADGVTFEERVEQFERCRHPERALSRQVAIAQAFQGYSQKHELSGDAKKEVHRVLLMRSEASVKEVLSMLELVELSKDAAAEVIHCFDALADLASRLHWLVGDRITVAEFSAEAKAYEITFESGARLYLQCLWRLLDDGELCLTGEDHCDQFGLPRPVDCVATLRALGAHPISSVQVREGTVDLILGFGSHLVLEVLRISAGYESWHLWHPTHGSFDF
jgi:hypothetical protein